MAEEVLYPLSLGDRVRVRIATPGKGVHPALLVLAGDGTANGPEPQRAVIQFGSWAVVACLDLPLHGSRTSEKLSAIVFDRDHPLSAELWNDVVQQLDADLATVANRLRARPDVRADRIALVAWGVGAQLARDLPDPPQHFARIDLLPTPADLAPLAQELRTKLL